MAKEKASEQPKNFSGAKWAPKSKEPQVKAAAVALLAIFKEKGAPTLEACEDVIRRGEHALHPFLQALKLIH